jgi:tetratricopeptide (TPR) repeat protein
MIPAVLAFIIAYVVLLIARKSKKNLVESRFEKNPDDINLLKKRGRIARNHNDFVKYLDSFEKVLKLNPYDIEAKIRVASMYAFNKRYDEAFPMIEEIMKDMNEEKSIKLAYLAEHMNECMAIIYYFYGFSIYRSGNLNRLDEAHEYKKESIYFDKSIFTVAESLLIRLNFPLARGFL